MGSCRPAVKAWLSWLKGSVLLIRLIGLPAALLALHLEIYGYSASPASLIFYRLSQRLRLNRLACIFTKDIDNGLTSFFFVGGADVMDRAQSPHKPKSLARKRSRSLDKGRNSTSSSGAGLPPASSLSQPPADLPMPPHARSTSNTDVVRQGKRLSLQFPIQPAAGSNSPLHSPRSRPQSWVAAPSPMASPGAAAPSPTEPPNILAVLAAQERYVLELKEELVKAEEDLKKLKKAWQTHESVKQRNDLRKVTQLQPLNTNLANFRPDLDDEDGSSVWMQREMERRKALLNGTKSSQRKVFSGSRHLRTLSLLSPDKTYSPSFPQPPDVRDPADEPRKQPPPPMRTMTSPEIASEIATTVNGDRYDLTGLSAIQRDALLRTGKQMATDFKDGLLTFIEDIRQATVGEEAVDGSGSASVKTAPTKNVRKAPNGRPSLVGTGSRHSTPQQSVDIGDDFWKEHGLSEPKTSPTNKKTHSLKHTRTPQKKAAKEEEFEEWDSWETPENRYTDKAASSSDEEDGATASSRTSTRYHSKRHDSKASSLTTNSSNGAADETAARDPKRNSIPWPDMVKLSPNNLKRTASHLMKEWEKNLTPPPESRNGSHVSGDYIGRSMSPTDGP